MRVFVCAPVSPGWPRGGENTFVARGLEKYQKTSTAIFWPAAKKIIGRANRTTLSASFLKFIKLIKRVSGHQVHGATRGLSATRGGLTGVFGPGACSAAMLFSGLSAMCDRNTNLRTIFICLYLRWRRWLDITAASQFNRCQGETQACSTGLGLLSLDT